MSFNREDFHVLRQYYCLVRKYIEAENEELNDRMFLTLGGGKSNHVNDAIQNSAVSQGIELPMHHI